MSRFAIVAVGYNRVNGMDRLLNSLDVAVYDEQVDLIISIDNSGSDEVETAASRFVWKHGNKRIVTYPERLGLRKHIIRCGDFLDEYDAIAVLEDDIIVSPGFFQYMRRTVDRYGSDNRIAGISLYSFNFNQGAEVPFCPAASGYDTFFIQRAQSWGQVWMKDQWFAFKKWYESHNEAFSEGDHIPANVCAWPESSWLKYHIRYCIENDKFFVYPYKSMSTCFSDIGQHTTKHETLFQVPLMYGTQSEYRLPDLNNAPVKYDAFFERILPEDFSVSGVGSDDICVDLYSTKKTYSSKRYLLSTRLFPYRIIDSFSMEIKPIEMNVILGIKGSGIYLYDSQSGRVSSEKAKKQMSLEEFKYRWLIKGQTGNMRKAIRENMKNRSVARIKRVLYPFYKMMRSVFRPLSGKK